MNNHTIRELKEQIAEIKETPSGQTSTSLLQEVVAGLRTLPATLPAWFSEKKITRYEDLDCLLNNLSNSIKMMYNASGSTVFVYTPDLFVARVAFDVVKESMPCVLYRKSQKDTPASDAAAMFIPVASNAASIRSAASGCVLLCPGRFDSRQIFRISQIVSDSDVLMLDPDGIADLSGAVRTKDIEKLELSLARWQVESTVEHKSVQLSEIITHIDAMLEWM